MSSGNPVLGWRDIGARGVSGVLDQTRRVGAGGVRSFDESGGPYLGQVVGQLMLPQTLLVAASATQIMCRKAVYSRSAITSLRLLYPNWYVDNSTLVETGSGNTITITAAIEYPVGVTCTQVLWSGSASTNVADLANSDLSDACVIPGGIPINTKFFIRTYVTCTVATPLQNRTGCADSAFNTGSFKFATSGLTDTTMTPGVPAGGTNSANFMYQPLVAAGTTSAPSVLILGDSRQEGNASSESYANTSGDIGTIARCIGPYFAYCNLGKGSDSYQQFLVGNALRSSIKNYFSHVLSGYGINDVITLSRSAATTYADAQTVRAIFPNQKFFQITLAPYATSSDFFTTIAAETTNARNAVRISFNSSVLAAAGLTGFFDVTTLSENTPNSDGKWTVSPLGRVVADATAVSGVATLTSVLAVFTSGDTGGAAVCAALGFTSALNRIMTFVDSSNVTMSGTATASLAAQTASINAQRDSWDGVHETTAMNLRYLAGSVIPQSAITR